MCCVCELRGIVGMTTGRGEKKWENKTETISHNRKKKTKCTDNTTSKPVFFFISLVSLCRHVSQCGSQQRDRGECAEILTTACAVVCLVFLSLWLLLPLLIVKVCFSSVTGATVLRTQRQHVLWCALCFYLFGFFFQSNLPAVVQQ